MYPQSIFYNIYTRVFKCADFKRVRNQDLGKLENPSIASHLSFLQIIVPISPFYPVSQNIYGSCNHSYTLVILIFKNRINQNKVFTILLNQHQLIFDDCRHASRQREMI